MTYLQIKIHRVFVPHILLSVDVRAGCLGHRGPSGVGAESPGCQARAPRKEWRGESSEESAVIGNDKEGQGGVV